MELEDTRPGSLDEDFHARPPEFYLNSGLQGVTLTSQRCSMHRSKR